MKMALVLLVLSAAVAGVRASETAALVLMPVTSPDSTLKLLWVKWTPPTRQWQKIRIPLINRDGTPSCNGASGFRLGFKPRGKIMTYWIRNLSYVKPRTSESRAADFCVTDYGAVPDGATTSTTAIQRAIDDCAKTGRQLRLATGFYTFTAVHAFEDGGPDTAVCIRNMHREFALLGERRRLSGWPKDMKTGDWESEQFKDRVRKLVKKLVFSVFVKDN